MAESSETGSGKAKALSAVTRAFVENNVSIKQRRQREQGTET